MYTPPAESLNLIQRYFPESAELATLKHAALTTSGKKAFHSGLSNGGKIPMAVIFPFGDLTEKAHSSETLCAVY